MDGFFGIGFGELVMIAIVALIVLGPERLPSALREVAKFIRQIRNLSKEFTDQFGDDFKALEDLNPRRLLQEAIDNIDEEEKGKEKVEKTPAKKNPTATTTAKKTTSSTPKPTTTKTNAAKATTASATTKPATESAVATTATIDTSTGADDSAAKKGNDEGTTDKVEEKTTPESTGVTASQPAAPGIADSATSADVTPAEPIETEPENRIAPPNLASTSNTTEVAAEPVQAIVQTNGHALQSVVAESIVEHQSAAPVTPTDEMPPHESVTSDPVDMSVVGVRQVDGEETQP